MIPTTNRNLWADEPHHRPTKQELIDAARRDNYMPDPSIPLHKQSLLSVTPPTPEEKAEAEWELTDDDVHKAQIAAATARNAATIRQLEQDQWDRYYEEHGYPEQPIRSQSQERMRRMIG